MAIEAKDLWLGKLGLAYFIVARYFHNFVTLTTFSFYLIETITVFSKVITGIRRLRRDKMPKREPKIFKKLTCGKTGPAAHHFLHSGIAFGFLSSQNFDNGAQSSKTE